MQSIYFKQLGPGLFFYSFCFVFYFFVFLLLFFFYLAEQNCFTSQPKTWHSVLHVQEGFKQEKQRRSFSSVLHVQEGITTRKAEKIFLQSTDLL